MIKRSVAYHPTGALRPRIADPLVDNQRDIGGIVNIGYPDELS